MRSIVLPAVCLLVLAALSLSSGTTLSTAVVANRNAKTETEALHVTGRTGPGTPSASP
jgi:hypothetical protein